MQVGLDISRSGLESPLQVNTEKVNLGLGGR